MYRKIAIALIGAFVVSMLSTQSFAQDDDKKKKRGNQFMKNMMRPFAKAELTDEQKKKATALIKENAKELMALQKEMGSIFTAEKRKARREAQKKAKAEGLKGKKAAEFVWKEIGLSDDDRKKMMEANKKFNQARMKVQREIYAMLTDDQKAKVKSRALKGGKGKGKRKKKKKKDKDGDGDN